MGDIGLGSGSSYPVNLDTQSSQEVDSPSTSKTRLRSAVPNDLIACALAVERAVGTSPQGSTSDVKTFLQTEHAVDGTHGTYISTQFVATTTGPYTNPDYRGVANFTYQNTTGKMMYIGVSQEAQAIGATTNAQLKMLIDVNSPPTKVIAEQRLVLGSGKTGIMYFFGIVPPNYYYKIINTEVGEAPVGSLWWIEWH